MPKLLSKILFLTLLLVIQGVPVIADSNDTLMQANGDDFEALYGDEEFVSIATGVRKPVYKAPAVASVITADQIKAMGAQTLDEVLETVPGLHVAPSSLNRLNSIYSIRGIHTGENPQLLMLMNGLPFPYLYSGGRPQNFQLPIAAIARIEILRGPGSAVYGADAFSGVINIITKSANDIKATEIGVRVGSFNSNDLWLQHGGRIGTAEVMFSLEWQKGDGDRDRVINSDLQSLFDPAVSNAPGPLETRYDVLDMHLEFKWGNWRLRNWYWRLKDAGVGAGAAQALDPTGHDDTDSNLIDLSWQNDELVKNWELAANLSYYYSDSKTHFAILPAGTTVPLGTDGNLLSYPPFTLTNFPDGLIGNPEIIDRHLGLDFSEIYSGFTSHRIRIGTGFKHQEEDTSESKNFGPGITPGVLTDISNTPYVFMSDTNRTVWYLSLQDEWQFAPDWELTSGIRYDHYSDFGGTLNPRIALVWATRYNLTTKLLYGRAFRAPSFSEQFAKNNPVAIGNPDLDPETIDTLELAFDYRPTFDIQTNLSIFGYQANGLIEFVPDDSGVSKTAQNARDQRGYGFEFEVSWEVSHQLKLIGNYAWQHSEDVDTGHRVADAPGQQLLLAANWKFLPDWLLRPQLNWVASRHRATGDPRSEIDNYTLVDLTLRRSNLWNGFDLAVAVRNLFDEDAREPSSPVIPEDYPMEGRSLWAEVSYRF